VNSKQRNHLKKQIEEIKVSNWSLVSGMAMWGAFGLVTLITIVGPYFSYGYVKKYNLKRKENLVKIKDLEGKLL